jgi:hypothetical protein
MDWILTSLAQLLDMMPAEGRLMLLALLLSVAFTVFARLLPISGSHALDIVYRKAVLIGLLAVPFAVYVFNVRLPVAVAEVTNVATDLPAKITWLLLAVWLGGVLFHISLLSKSLRVTRAAVGGGDDSAGSMRTRLQHWQNRLNYGREVRLLCVGSERPWHYGGQQSPIQPTVVLPAFALHWPNGVVDVMLLTQLAALKQRGWDWMMFGRLVQTLYWPAPWVRTLVDDLAGYLVGPALRLAAAAYRDPEGWRRDLRQYEQRVTTLDTSVSDTHLQRLPFTGVVEQDNQEVTHALSRPSFAQLDKRARERRKARLSDPHEQAYWLIAAASIVVATATTLTRVPTPPEQEYVPLLQQWETTMFRTIAEYEKDSNDTDDPPRKKP